MTLTVVLIIAIIVIAIMCYVFYVKKTGRVLKQARIVHYGVSGRHTPDDQSVVPDTPPVVEST